jgi:hypothetical protein
MPAGLILIPFLAQTLTHPPRDSSPRIGFWDKLRLVFHWSVEWTFQGPVHIHAKGARP